MPIKSLKEGLKKSAPPACDSSTKMPSAPSVNKDAVRKSVAPQPKTLGPRTA